VAAARMQTDVIPWTLKPSLFLLLHSAPQKAHYIAHIYLKVCFANNYSALRCISKMHISRPGLAGCVP
jgi:hypothetical protein